MTEEQRPTVPDELWQYLWWAQTCWEAEKASWLSKVCCGHFVGQGEGEESSWKEIPPTDSSGREWICLQDGLSLYTLAIFYCHCLCWQVSLRPGFVPWGTQSCSSASLGSGGGKKSQKKNITNKTEEQPQSNAFQVPFLLESQAHPNKEETRK